MSQDELKRGQRWVEDTLARLLAERSTTLETPIKWTANIDREICTAEARMEGTTKALNLSYEALEDCVADKNVQRKIEGILRAFFVPDAQRGGETGSVAGTPIPVNAANAGEDAVTLPSRSAASGETNDRRFATLAIEEARKSTPEDDRVHPRVGVVVVKDGRILAAAHRGEFPESHAEYIALEKKLADAPLTGATVYTTLEPCTSRNHPKVPCAIRLAERKVSRVVIGMLDPDDRISGRGQRALRKAGIATELFPHDLMAEVEELNRDFVRDRESRENDVRNEKQGAPPEFYNFDGNPEPIRLTGITHSVQGPWMDVWGLVTIVNPTQSPMKIAVHRLVLGGKERAVHSFFFRLKSNPMQRFERISLMGNTKEDYELHVMFSDTDYPIPPSRDGELWVSSGSRPGEFPVKIRCP
jgi:pyrimidine deaminase RibD-like protein